MKTYDKLSKADREKLSLYLQYLNGAKTQATIIVGCSFVFIAIGIPLWILTMTPIVMFAGAYCFMTGLILMLVGLGNVLFVRKNLFLIFGYKDSFQDVFEVTSEDLKKIRITKEIKYKWSKEN